jgi:AraC-like DNA-binding protein
VIDRARSSPVVATLLTASERARVDAAGTGLFVATHRDSIDEVIGDIRGCRANAVVISVARCAGSSSARIVSRVASIVRDFPRIATLALLADTDGQVPPSLASTVLALGCSGIRTLIDARQPVAWQALREAVIRSYEAARQVDGAAIQQLRVDLGDAPTDCHRFFAALFTSPATVTTVEALSRTLGVRPTTLVSRFARRGLPSPKTYLAGARITRAAAILEDQAVSIAAASTSLEYSSPQSFGRHLLARLGVTPTEFRETYDGARMLDRFRKEIVLPHLATLRAFSPLAPPSIRRGRPRLNSPLARRPFVSRIHVGHDFGRTNESQHRVSLGLDSLKTTLLAVHEGDHTSDHAT